MEYWEYIHIQGLDDLEESQTEILEALMMESSQMITNVDGGKGSGVPATQSQVMDVVPLVVAITEFIAADKSWIGDMWDWILGLLGIEPEMPTLPAIVEAFPEVAALVTGGSGALVAAKVAQIALYGFGKMAIELGQEQLKEWIHRKLDGVDESPEKNLELIRQLLETQDATGDPCDPPVPIGSLLQAINKRLATRKYGAPRGEQEFPLGTQDLNTEEPETIGDNLSLAAVGLSQEEVVEIDGTRVWLRSKVVDT